MEVNALNELLLPSVVVAVVVGGAFLLLRYVLSVVRGNSGESEEKTEKNAKEVPEHKRQLQQSNAASKKKKIVDNRTSRNDKQPFADKWLRTSMKGHTGQVLDMDYSSNGRFLASCSDEDDSASTKNSNGTDRDSSSSLDYQVEEVLSPPLAKPSLTRRQRKNRKREENSSLVSKSKSKSKKVHSVQEKNSHKNEISPMYGKLGVPDADLTTFLRTYLLSPEQMLVLGYPMNSSHHLGKVIIFKGHTGYYYQKKKTYFDVNAKEFYPRSYKQEALEDSSSHDSGNSSESGLDDEEKPREIFMCDYNSVIERSEFVSLRIGKEATNKKSCVRCGEDFCLNPEESTYVKQDFCCYHWGKLSVNLTQTPNVLKYQCCGGFEGAIGCSQGKFHVWTGVSPGINGPFDNYVRTRYRRTPPPDGNNGAYAIDCEMCYTVNGLEVVKVTVVGLDGRLVYDTFVKPENEIIDYNSRFSGITAKDFQKRKSLKTLREVQNDLMGFISSDTILIGHGLENDLRVLRILHPMVVDTAVSFPHRNGLPYRRPLKQLASCFLKREIQTGSEGHNSFEDARACVDLMLMKIGRDFRTILQHSYGC